MLITHADQIDESLTSVNSLSLLGGRAYTLGLRTNDWYSCERLKLDQRSLRAYLKRPFARAVSYLTVTRFNELKVLQTVRRHRADGIICGHSHRVEQQFFGPVCYVNDGDWVGNCTTLVEHYRGLLNLLSWTCPQAPISSNKPEATLSGIEASL